jgi:hypothetical protein
MTQVITTPAINPLAAFPAFPAEAAADAQLVQGDGIRVDVK